MNEHEQILQSIIVAKPC